MTNTTTQQAVIAFLQRDALRNIVPLKMLTAHPDVIETHYHEAGPDAAALLLFPTNAFAYDRATYGDLDLVVILVATTPAAAKALAPLIPRHKTLICKLMDSATRELLAESFALQRVTAFLSFTATALDRFPPHPAVVVADQVDERLYPLFAQQGYSVDELERYFAGGQARTFACYEAGDAVAACFTYQNFAQIHEIGGVYTLPTQRRKGYAQQAVVTAVHSLLSRGCWPRYQVHEINRPSIALAEQMGLTPFVTVEHWRYTETTAA